MTIYFTPTFIEDLKDADDARFIRRVLDHVCDKAGKFAAGKDDHRYKGIEGAWIRYVSAGRTAFRLIYIRRGEHIYLYRTGVHSVEDNLTTPRELEGVELSTEMFEKVVSTETPLTMFSVGTLLKTSNTMMLSVAIRGMTQVKHKEILLVSPYYSASMFARNAPFGRFLDRAIEENTMVYFVTKPSSEMDMDFFASLEERGIYVYLHARLHAKLYLFDVELESLNKYSKDVKQTAILGSANLTDMGVALAGTGGNEELCYRLPETQFAEAREHAGWLMRQSEDFVTYKSKAFKRF